MAGSKINVLAHIEIGRQIVDYMLVGSKHCQRLFFIPVTSKYLASNEIIRYCVMDNDHVSVKHFFAEKKDALYYRILPSDKPNRDRVFYALSLNSRNIHVLEIKRGVSYNVVLIVNTRIAFFLMKRFSSQRRRSLYISSLFRIPTRIFL